MTLAKRFCDVLLAVTLGLILLPVAAGVALVLLLREGRPIFYISERMKTVDKGFNLVKFRTMSEVTKDSGVSGGDKSDRINTTGEYLRRKRLDEIPQIWNVLKGDISFVGPRPPLKEYVERFPEIYREVLRSRPGITGLASVYFHAHEERLLERTTTPEETDEIYCKICVPRKARLDLIYQKRRNLCLDAMLMLKTVFKRLR